MNKDVIVSLDKEFYHGSSVEIEKPDLKHSRKDIDFGAGFYLTQDDKMAKKWACNRNESILNAYKIDFTNLNIKYLTADKEWLDYVSWNRTHEKKSFDDSDYDIIIGPTADDKLFVIIDMYQDGLVSADRAIEVMNCMNYSQQIALKTVKAIRNIEFVFSKKLYGQEKEQLRESFIMDTRLAAQKTRELLRKLNR